MTSDYLEAYPEAAVLTLNRSVKKYTLQYMGQGSQEWTKQNLWKTAFKKSEVIWSA